MESHLRPRNESQRPESTVAPPASPGVPSPAGSQNPEPDIFWALVGSNGLRSGWSAVLFIALYYLFLPVLGTIAVSIDPSLAEETFSPVTSFLTELIPLISLLAAMLFLSRVEHRHLPDYHLRDTRWRSHLASGFLAGFLALSGLVAILTIGGWLRLSHSPLSTGYLVQYGVLWAVAFLAVGLFEEGSFRCYLQYTLARGMNFWWALAAVCLLCLAPQLRVDPQGTAGVYVVAALGLVPCWLVHRARRPGSSFWQAAWATSTAFGAYHTGNHGESWTGILTAASIGFIFCISVRVTGSAWWAIGCHAAWDWAETYFYGTADSGLATQSHLMVARASGRALFSGGDVGPEGSLLALPVVALMLAGLLVFHRPHPADSTLPEALPLVK